MPLGLGGVRYTGRKEAEACEQIRLRLRKAGLPYSVEAHFGNLAWYVDTWMARDPSGTRCVIKTAETIVRDDYGAPHDLRTTHREVLDRLRTHASLRPPPPIVAWTRLHEDESSGLLVLERPFGELWWSRLPATGPASPTNPPDLTAFAHLAEGLDWLDQNLPQGDVGFPLKVSNLLAGESGPRLVDWGIAALQSIVSSTVGPQQVTQPAPPEGSQLPLPSIRLTDSTRSTASLWALGSVYFTVRTGRTLLPDTGLVARELLAAYEACQELAEGRRELSELPDSRERAVVREALQIDASSSYPSCSAFVRALSASLSATS